MVIESDRKFRHIHDPAVSGSILTQHARLIQALLDEPALQIEVRCTIESDGQQTRKSRRPLARMIPCVLSIILYGPMELFEEIGEFFQDYDMYLQDPRACTREVKYYNPHRLSSADLESCPMTSDVGRVGFLEAGTDLLDAPAPPDLLALLNSQGDLAETDQSTVIKTSLER